MKDRKPRGIHRADRVATVDLAGRDLPHDDAAELSVCRTLFRHCSHAVDLMPWLLPEHFYDDRTGLVYGAQCKVVAAEGLADPVTVRAQLTTDGTWDRVGDDHMQRILREGTSSEHLIGRLAEIVANKAKRRAVIDLALKTAIEGYDDGADDAVWADSACERFIRLSDASQPQTGGTARDIVRDMFGAWSGDAPVEARLGTGHTDIDRLFRKMRPAQLIVIGAHSGIGKTALASGFAVHVAVSEQHDDKPCGVYIQSLEMSASECMERMVFGRARVPAYKSDEEHRNKITDEEWGALTQAAKDLSIDHLYIDDRAGITPSGIVASVTRQALRMERAGTPLRLVVVDYAQIVEGDLENKRRSDNREQEIAQVSRRMKQLAKDLHVTVLLLAQLNEDSTKDGRKPSSRDLRESRSLKHDADKVVLIYNPSASARAAAYRNGERVDTLGAKEHVDLIVDKNRGGLTGTVAATFLPTYASFVPFEGTEQDIAFLRDSAPKRGKGNR